MITPQDMDARGVDSLSKVRFTWQAPENKTGSDIRSNKRLLRTATATWMYQAIYNDLERHRSSPEGHTMTLAQFHAAYPQTKAIFADKLRQLDSTLESQKTYNTYFGESRTSVYNVEEARKALATSFESSLLHKLVVIKRSLGTQ